MFVCAGISVAHARLCVVIVFTVHVGGGLSGGPRTDGGVGAASGEMNRESFYVCVYKMSKSSSK